MNFRSNTFLTKIILLQAAMYLAGGVGLYFESTQSLFQLLTPFHLLTTAALLLYFHTDWQHGFRWFVAITLLVGYFIEVLGVNTGLIFGNYQYLHTLGPKIWGVPPLIGVNWMILVYTFGHLFHRLLADKMPRYLVALLAAIAMTLFDVVVEPVAMAQDMWNWFGEEPPMSNYYGWLGISFMLQLVYFYLPFDKKNPLANWILLFQFLFFVGLRLAVNN